MGTRNLEIKKHCKKHGIDRKHQHAFNFVYDLIFSCIVVVPNRRYWGCLALDHAHTRCFLLASAWSDRWCKQLRTKKWLVTCEVKHLPANCSEPSGSQNCFSPKNPASTHFFLGYIFFHRKPRIHTSNGRTIGPTYQRFIYQWMLSHSTMSFLPSPLILDILMLKTLVKCSHPRKNHKLRWQIKRWPYTKILKNTRIQTANPNSELERCVLHQIYEVIL